MSGPERAPARMGAEGMKAYLAPLFRQERLTEASLSFSWERDGRVGSPCGACRELMMQLDADSGDIEILTDLETKKTVRLNELVPDWWGRERFDEASKKE